MIFLSRLLKFLEKQTVLTDDQFGFRQGKSTTDTVNLFAKLVVVTILKIRNRLLACLRICLRYSTASDVELSWTNSNPYGVRGVPHAWLETYMVGSCKCIQESSIVLKKTLQLTKITLGIYLWIGLFLNLSQCNSIVNYKRAPNSIREWHESLFKSWISMNPSRTWRFKLLLF